MASKSKKTADIDIDLEMDEALEQVLDLELSDEINNIDLDGDLSLDDYEEKVSKAAGELKSASAKPAAKKTTPARKKKPAKPAPSTRAPSPAPAPSPVAPANDDSASKDYVQTISRLESKPAGNPFLTASIFSLLWVIGGVAVAHILYAPEIWTINSVAGLREFPGAIGVMVGTIIPIFFIFVLALMLRRAAEMRQTAKSMSEIAFRLAAPEKLAGERVATVGEAVRREVAAMGDGIERTIARATELEAMMQSEVSDLERVYTDNEARVRSILTALATIAVSTLFSIHDQTTEEGPHA
ncbi:MAG: hypothetical protein AAF940_06050 [Pseudomonadota bacterium]